jgi:hypothetical protein
MAKPNKHQYSSGKDKHKETSKNLFFITHPPSEWLVRAGNPLYSGREGENRNF